MRRRISAVTSRSNVRIVPSITASCGMIFGACPALNLPIVTMAGVFAGSSRAVIS